MKTIKKIAMLFVLLTVTICLAPQKATSQISVSFQLFYDDLSPHGYWVNDPNYGYVWAPNVQQGFSPYSTNGYWVFTDYGWTWVSNYSWGWAPFHYGRWFHDPYYGWLWAPDTEWGPAWVTWRQSEGYYGWAPIGPGISINIAFGSSYNLPYNQWTFVRDRYFGSPNINNYYVNSSNNVTIINNSTVINNIQTNNTTRSKYNAGPDRADVQKRTNAPIRQLSLKDRDQPGQRLNKNELQLYKPRIEKNDTQGRKPVPPRVVNKEDIKPISERNKEAQVLKENPKVNQNRNKEVINQRDIKNQSSEPRVKPQNVPKKQNGQNKESGNRRETPQGTQQQRSEELNKQKEAQQERGNQQNKQRDVQQQRSEELNKQKEAQQERGNQQNKQREIQQQKSEELDKHQEILREHAEKQNKQLDVKQVELEKQRKEKKDFEEQPVK